MAKMGKKKKRRRKKKKQQKKTKQNKDCRQSFYSWYIITHHCREAVADGGAELCAQVKANGASLVTIPLFEDTPSEE